MINYYYKNPNYDIHIELITFRGDRVLKKIARSQRADILQGYTKRKTYNNIENLENKNKHLIKMNAEKTYRLSHLRLFWRKIRN